MITIDEYIQFIDEMKEIKILSPEFRIIEYKDGCLLGVNGRTMLFDNTAINIKDYIFWNELGLAYQIQEDSSSDVVIKDGIVTIGDVLYKVPYPSMNHPKAK